MYLRILLYTFIVSLSACQKELITNDIDPELTAYYDSFLKEASNRGVNIDGFTKGIILKFGDSNGYSARTYLSENRIAINPDQWKQFSPQEKEFTVFHELGHLILGRNHDKNTLPNGEFRSLMLTYEGVATIENTHLFLGIRRKYYLDELFKASTPPPDWSTADYNPVPVTMDRKLILSQDFNTNEVLTNFLKKVVTCQCNINSGVLNAKISAGSAFGLDTQKILELSNFTQQEINKVLESSNMEIEVSYRLKKGSISYQASNANKLPFMISHNTAGTNVRLTSELFQFNFQGYKLSGENGYNSIRLARKGSLIHIYLNEKHLFTTDFWSTESPAQVFFLIFGGFDSQSTEVDFDYFRIYERL